MSTHRIDTKTRYNERGWAILTQVRTWGGGGPGVWTPPHLAHDVGLCFFYIEPKAGPLFWRVDLSWTTPLSKVLPLLPYTVYAHFGVKEKVGRTG